MNRFVFFSFLILPYYLLSQQQDSIGFEEPMLYKFETDSIPNSGIRLEEVVLFQPLRFKSMNELRNYVILRNRTLRVYPYAKLAADRLDTLTSRLERIEKKRQKKIYIKRIEKFIYDEFEEELKKGGWDGIAKVVKTSGGDLGELVTKIETGNHLWWYLVLTVIVALAGETILQKRWKTTS